MVDLAGASIFLAAAYALGSCSSAYFVSKHLEDVDIRRIGSRNAGALNVFREIGMGPGVIVLGMDAAKGASVVGLAQWLALPEWAFYGAPIALVAGHNWPFLLEFQGGRGLAPVLGISLATLPVLTLLAMLPAAIIIIGSRSVVFGALCGFVILNILTLTTKQPLEFVVMCAALTALVGGTHLHRSWHLYQGSRHAENWSRLLQVE